MIAERSGQRSAKARPERFVDSDDQVGRCYFRGKCAECGAWEKDCRGHLAKSLGSHTACSLGIAKAYIGLIAEDGPKPRCPSFANRTVLSLPNPHPCQPIRNSGCGRSALPHAIRG
jgi:hypothetical protein